MNETKDFRTIPVGRRVPDCSWWELEPSVFDDLVQHRRLPILLDSGLDVSVGCRYIFMRAPAKVAFRVVDKPGVPGQYVANGPRHPDGPWVVGTVYSVSMVNGHPTAYLFDVQVQTAGMGRDDWEKRADL